MNTWGMELTLDCRAGNRDAVQSKEVIAKFMDDLVVKIDMVKYGPLWIERFATHDETKSGISALQMIETSNLVIHAVDGSGDIYLNVFSCKEFDTQVVIDLVNEYFAPESIKHRLYERQA